jgi:hypothetical protein
MVLRLVNDNQAFNDQRFATCTAVRGDGTSVHLVPNLMFNKQKKLPFVLLTINLAY